MNLSNYAKAITSLLTGLLAWGGQVVAAHPDDFQVSSAQWLALAGIVVTAILVFFVPNTPKQAAPVADNPGGGLNAGA